MKRKRSALLVLAVLLAAQLACNLPTRANTGDLTPLPGPEQTLTALFANNTPVTPGGATATLPPIFTATSEEAGGGIAPTVTQPAPAPTNTSAPPTATQPMVVPTVAVTQLFPTQRPPQATSVPLPTNTSAPAARREVFQAKFLNTPPTIDGDWSEWKDLTEEYPAANIAWGRENWTGADDLAGSYHIGWDNNNLYIAVKVRDDRYVQNATGANIYQGDSLEILLDTNLQGDFYYGQLSADDFQLGINPGRPDPNGAREAYLWFPASITGARSSITIASRLEAGIYRVEAAIPWNVFETTPGVGKRFGFALSVSDNDDPAQNAQQSMVSNISNRSLTDPTTWGELRLIQ